MTGERAGSECTGPRYGARDAGVKWSYWDLWFALLCTRDHGGDWDDFDAAITQIGWSDGEAKWSHLQDLRKRLAAVGLSAGELVRRAMLTIGLDLSESCDDSYGALGDVIGEALEAYAGTDWRAADLPPEVFWPDFLEIATPCWPTTASCTAGRPSCSA